MVKKARKRIILKFWLSEPKDGKIKVEGELDVDAFDNQIVRSEIDRLLKQHNEENPATNKLTLQEFFPKRD